MENNFSKIEYEFLIRAAIDYVALENLYLLFSSNDRPLTPTKNIFNSIISFLNHMFEKNDKRRLYWLVVKYLEGIIDAPTFCDEFYYSYSLEISDDDLTEREQKYFSELDTIASRFSEFKEDHKNYPGTYFTEKQLKDKIIEVRNKLKDNIPNLDSETDLQKNDTTSFKDSR